MSLSPRQKTRWRRAVMSASHVAYKRELTNVRREFSRCADDWEAGRWDSSVHAERMTEILVALYTLTGQTFARIGRDMLADQRSAVAPEIELRADAYFGDRVAALIRTFGPMRARKIAERSQAILTEVLAQAGREGLSEAATARRVRSALADERLSLVRARTIARTEIGAAQNAGMLAAADELSIDVRKIWVSIHDTRTRPTHSNADGQTIGQGQKFQVGMAQLDHPGDPAALPQETINCRCTMLLEYAP